MEHAYSSALSADRTARKILAVLISDFRIGPGDILPLGSVSAGWHQCYRRHEDFDAGLQYAISHGWIEILSHGHKLTATGYAVAGLDAADGYWRGVTQGAAVVAGVPPAARY
jgi:hypothetical protein